MQEFIYIANWKAYLSYNNVDTFLTEHSSKLDQLTTKGTLVICPPTSVLALAEHLLYETSVQLGAQNVSMHEDGAHTGEDTARSLKEIGCTFCIIGHSERRLQHGETNEAIARKAQLLIKNEILPILCIGESTEERKAERTNEVLSTQISAVVGQLPTKGRLLIAYEPIWAIGTGNTASATAIEAALGQIRATMQAYPSIEYGLLYGGSVTPESAGSLKSIKGIDGFLIGGASTKYTELEKIIDS